jgi:hypothetical protein
MCRQPEGCKAASSNQFLPRSMFPAESLYRHQPSVNTNSDSKSIMKSKV